jgi:hypothetical protein
MDVSATALTAAWLDAVRRTQSETGELPARISAEKTMTDVIESALRHGGSDSHDPDWRPPHGGTLDVRV